MRSLRSRVALSAIGVLAAFVLLTSLALEQAFRDSARSARQERLLGQIYLLMAAAEVEGGALVLPPQLAEPRFGLPGSGLYAAVLDTAGARVWESPSNLGADVPFDGPLAPGERSFGRRPGPGGATHFVARFGVTWATGPETAGYTFAVAEDLKPYHVELARFRTSLAGWLGAMSLLLLAALLLAVRWGLAPLRQVAAELTQVEAGRGERIRGDYPAELRALTDNLNALLDHERARQKRLGNALGDLAHSLKTPLAILRGALDADGLPPETTRLMREQLERIGHTVEYQLQRARSGTGTPPGLAPPVPVAAAAQRLAASLQKVYRDRDITVEIDIPPVLVFRGVEGDLLELLGNLMDNACKWARQRVRVSADCGPDGLWMTVEDDGPGFPATLADRMLERGARADQAAPGHGIGLAVARDICEAYGGRIEVGRSLLAGAAVTARIGGTAQSSPRSALIQDPPDRSSPV